MLNIRHDVLDFLSSNAVVVPKLAATGHGPLSSDGSLDTSGADSFWTDVSGEYVWLVSGDGQYKEKVRWDTACCSDVICNMLKMGPFREAVEGRVEFPTIDACSLRETVLFLQATAMAQQQQALGADHDNDNGSVNNLKYSCSSLSVPQLFNLLLAAHFLNLRRLFARAARAVSERMHEVSNLHMLPDVIVSQLVYNLSAGSRLTVEYLLAAEERDVDCSDSWRREYLRRFGLGQNLTTRPEVKQCRQACLEYFLKKQANLYTPPSNRSTSHARSSRARKPPSKASGERSRFRAQLIHDFDIAGQHIRKFTLSNGVIDGKLLETLLQSLSNVTDLDISGVGYSTNAGISIARACRLLPPIDRLDLTNINMSVDGLRSLAAAWLSCEAQLLVNEKHVHMPLTVLPTIRNHKTRTSSRQPNSARRTTTVSREQRSALILHSARGPGKGKKQVTLSALRANQLASTPRRPTKPKGPKGKQTMAPQARTHSVASVPVPIQAPTNKGKATLHLSLRGNPIGDVAVTAFATRLAAPPSAYLCSLQIGRNRLGQKGAMIIADTLRKQRGLHHLDVSFAALSKKGVAAIALAAASPHCHLESLNLSGNFMSSFTTAEYSSYPDPGKCLAKLLVESKTLQSLSVASNNFMEEDLYFMMHALQNNHHLKTLDVSGIPLSDTVSRLLSSALEQNSSLRTLIMQNTELSESSLILLSRTLQTNATLTSVDLTGCDWKIGAAEAMGAALAVNSTLTSLNVCGSSSESASRLRTEGAQALTRGLRRTSALRVLNLSMHGLRNTGCVNVVSNVLNARVEELVLSGNHVDAKGALALMETVMTSDYIVHPTRPDLSNLCINMTNNTLTNHGVDNLRSLKCTEVCLKKDVPRLRDQQTKPVIIFMVD